MERRSLREVIARNVTAAIAAAGVDITIVAQAADIHPSTLESRLRCETPFDAVELVRVGGFLCIPTRHLIEGVPA